MADLARYEVPIYCKVTDLVYRNFFDCHEKAVKVAKSRSIPAVWDCQENVWILV